MAKDRQRMVFDVDPLIAAAIQLAALKARTTNTEILRQAITAHCQEAIRFAQKLLDGDQSKPRRRTQPRAGAAGKG